MWMVDWCPKLALEVIEAWGFIHKTTAFTWAKRSEHDESWHFGMGYWTRANPEVCWLATRGHPKRIHADVAQLIVSPVMEHSRKPNEIYTRIERLVDGPYLELYARRERQGWLTWGNELEFRVPTVASGMTNTDRSSKESTDFREFPDLPAFLKRDPDGLAPWQHDLAASYPHPQPTRPTTNQFAVTSSGDE
jgi:hypothetical protein